MRLRCEAATPPKATSSRTDPAMSTNNAILAIAAVIAFAAAIYVAARPETQAVSFAMPMTIQSGGQRR
jgi:hypothetical protein